MAFFTKTRLAVALVIVCPALVFCVIRLRILHASLEKAEQTKKIVNAPNAPGAATCCLPATTTADEQNRIIYQEFPANGPTETAWLIVWTEFGQRGLWIEAAWFRPTPGGPFIEVLGQSGLSNIFVPYHLGLSRPYDLNQYGNLHEAMPSYAGACGTISGPLLPSTSSVLAATTSPRRVLVKEIRDRGVAWTSAGRTRRGEEVLLWAVQDTGNYEYIIQYGFRDDGTVTFRLGSTGFNSTSKPYEAHMHDALWHVDINLGQADRNSVSVMKHFEPATAPIGTTSPLLQATDTMTPFNGGTEGFVDWNASEFTCLNIQDNVAVNARGHNISYDLMPMRPGTARHAEPFSKHDFWVTKNNPNEVDYDGALISYVNAESIADTDVVLWYMSSNHHQPRDEDHEFDASSVLIPQGGIAQAMWSGFDLHPRNLMDDAPLHGCLPVPQGIVAWWQFEELAGATQILDSQTAVLASTGVPFPAALGQGGPTPTKGPIGEGLTGALTFDGVDDFIVINTPPSLNFGAGDFSADFWMKAAPNATGVILDKRAPTTVNHYQGYHLFFFGTPGLQLANGTAHLNYEADVRIDDGFWHHVGVTVNRTGNPQEIRWYIDGALVKTIPSPLAGSLDNLTPLHIGSRSIPGFPTPDGVFNGALGELELYNRALTPAEMHAIYTSGKCK